MEHSAQLLREKEDKCVLWELIYELWNQLWFLQRKWQV